MHAVLKRLAVVAAFMAVPTLSNAGNTLTIGVYNPGAASLFPVSSILVTGPTEAVLIDAQFQRNDARAVVDMIEASGKRLTTVYVSHGDPDFYFGLDVVQNAYPDTKIVASPATVKKIAGSIEGKQAYWSPILGDNAPRRVILPEALEGDTLLVDGQALKIVGLDGHDPAHTFIWIPSLNAVVGGVVVYENEHVWIADSQTAQSRRDWFLTLDRIVDLQPDVVIPGHFLGDSSRGLAAVEFTRDYVQTFEAAAERAGDAAELIAIMIREYPKLGGVSDLELSAKVIEGEMAWPQ